MFQEAQDTPLPEDDEDLWNLCCYINYLMPSIQNLRIVCYMQCDDTSLDTTFKMCENRIVYNKNNFLKC